MSLELVMVQALVPPGLQLGHGAGSVITGGVFTITSTPSIKSKHQAFGAYRGPLSWTFLGGSGGGFDLGTVTGTGTINPTAIKGKVDGQFVIRLGDSDLGSFVGTIATVPGTPINQPVEVVNAGQTKVRSE